MKVSSYKFELNGVCYPKPKAGKYARQLKSWRDNYGKKPCEKKEVNKYDKKELFKFLNGSDYENIVVNFLRQRHYHIAGVKYKPKSNIRYNVKSYDYKTRINDMEVWLSMDRLNLKRSYMKKYTYKAPESITVYSDNEEDEFIQDAIQQGRVYIYTNVYKYPLNVLIAKSCWKAFSYLQALRKPYKDIDEIDVYGYELEALGYDDDEQDQTDFVRELMNSLNKEQRTIINLIANGLTQREIAGKLHISRRKLNYKLSELRQFAKKLSYEF